MHKLSYILANACRSMASCISASVSASRERLHRPTPNTFRDFSHPAGNFPGVCRRAGDSSYVLIFDEFSWGSASPGRRPPGVTCAPLVNQSKLRAGLMIVKRPAHLCGTGTPEGFDQQDPDAPLDLLGIAEDRSLKRILETVTSPIGVVAPSGMSRPAQAQASIRPSRPISVPQPCMSHFETAATPGQAVS